MRSDPNTRKSSAFSKFHQERDHKTEDCIGLRHEVVQMLSQGHLKELLSDPNFARGREQPQGPPKPPSPACTIQMVIGGGDGATINHVKFTTTHKLKRSTTHERLRERRVYYPSSSPRVDETRRQNNTALHNTNMF
ncbi:PREDICTED: uncharacterized protein LOC109208077 [Nicotiana attenuata]|uniref:uncharacterized protein LOC109208077 n=1 Tax=Nicotiana attenuata TaxID=49451 RepID=UPI00090496EB|nr:PREDICTED: uncharacterized protein LOC109208077 [Nicotiana attenuata]